MIIPAKLDQKIAIQAVTNTTDGMGSTVESWATVSGAPTWAEYIPLRGTEKIMAGQVSEKPQCKLRIRRYASLTEANRVVHDSTNYEILSIEDNHRDGDMVLWCREALT